MLLDRVLFVARRTKLQTDSMESTCGEWRSGSHRVNPGAKCDSLLGNCRYSEGVVEMVQDRLC